MPRKGNRCTTMVNFQLTPLEATALQAVVVHFSVETCACCSRPARPRRPGLNPPRSRDS